MSPYDSMQMSHSTMSKVINSKTTQLIEHRIFDVCESMHPVLTYTSKSNSTYMHSTYTIFDVKLGHRT